MKSLLEKMEEKERAAELWRKLFHAAQQAAWLLQDLKQTKTSQYEELTQILYELKKEN